MDLIAPSAIAATGTDNPVVALEWPRPDFRLACLEFLIGLLTVAYPPTGNRAWTAAYREPPDAAALAAAFAPLAHAFVLDGDGPRFMQDFEDFPGDSTGIGTLLIEAPGKATTDKNTDLMVRRGRVGVLSRAAAAMALFTLQTYAPAGGAGNRTSLRGGGPLTTLAIPPPLPGEEQTLLWHLLWANVPIGEPPDQADLGAIFPWLRPTRLSDKTGRATTPADVNPLQAFWGMPRRIRLVFSTNDSGAACDLTGAVEPVVVRSWRQRPWGANYEQWGGRHVLSPCYRAKPGAELLYLHPQPGGIGYQHWQGVLSRGLSPTRKIAPCIDTFRNRLTDIRTGPAPWRLLAGGFDMDNMKARGFTESELPVTEPTDPEAARAVDHTVSGLVAGSNIAAGILARATRRALFGDGATIAADATQFAALRERLWSDTANDFFAAAEALGAGTAEAADIRAAWRATLEHTARALFAETAPIDASGEGHPGRIAASARQLGLALRGFGKEGSELFAALGLELPEAARKKQTKQKALA
jgi:CRISPR system Cascade subunit CasA